MTAFYLCHTAKGCLGADTSQVMLARMIFLYQLYSCHIFTFPLASAHQATPLACLLHGQDMRSEGAGSYARSEAVITTHTHTWQVDNMLF